MKYLGDILDILLPNLFHWQIWISFILMLFLILGLDRYSHAKKSRQFFTYDSIVPITAVVSLYIFMKLLEEVIYNGSVLKLDYWFNALMVKLHNPLLTNIAIFITSFGNSMILYSLLIITIGILLLRKRWLFASISIIAIIGATLLQLIIKNLVGRVRPDNPLVEVSSGLFSNSFPSGHAITAIVYVSFLIYSFKGDIKNLTTKYTLIALTSAFFISVGLTRIYLNVHWFSDVIAGMALGLFWFMFIVIAERSINDLTSKLKSETKKAKRLAYRK